MNSRELLPSSKSFAFLGIRASTIHGFSSRFFFGELLFPSEEWRVIDHFLVYQRSKNPWCKRFSPTCNRIIRKLSGAFLPNDHRCWVHRHYPIEMIFFPIIITGRRCIRWCVHFVPQKCNKMERVVRFRVRFDIRNDKTD